MEREPRAAEAVARCEALTEHGARCRRAGTYPVEVGDRTVRLCGPHRKQARRGTVALHDRPLTPEEAARRHGRPPPWTDEEDAWLAGHPDATTLEAAAHLGRPPAAVYQRRLRLGRSGGG